MEKSLPNQAGPSQGSVTAWLRDLESGSNEAALEIWNRYFKKVAVLAKSKLACGTKRVADEEDVAISVFDTLCRGIAGGRFPLLNDRHDLWRLLIVITHQKAVDQKRYLLRKKRGGGQSQPPLSLTFDSLIELIGREPTPDILAAIAEEYRLLLEALGDEVLRRIATSKMEGYTKQEIAAEHRVSVRTIERKLRLIQEKWSATGWT